jgi:hypothetical protein
VIDKSVGKRRRWRRLAWGAAGIPLLYILPYFLLGEHRTGHDYVNGQGYYTWHDRDYRFDPWIYQPLAVLESKLRGPDVQVVLDGSPGRDGSATYIFWSGNPKF